MRKIVQAFAFVTAPAVAVALAVRGAQASIRADAVASTLLITTTVAALAGCAWSQLERTRSSKLRQAFAAEQSRSRAALHLRDGLIGGGRESIVVWDSAGGEPVSFGSGTDLLALCLAGDNRTAVSDAVARLRHDGAEFTLTTDPDCSGEITLRGCVIGGHAAVFLSRQHMASNAISDKNPIDAGGYVHALNQLEQALAIFGPDRRLVFHNRCYARLWGLSKGWLDSHPTEGEILDRLRELRLLPEQADFAAWKRARLELFEGSSSALEELWHLPNGLTLRVVARRRPSGGFVHLFEDISERLSQKSAYNALIKVQQATLDTLQEAVAVFGTDGRLRLHNNAFARQWRLQEDDLRSRPHLKAIAYSCTRRFGHDRLWEAISAAVISASPESHRGAVVVERSDGRIISLALTRLPDGATLVTFSDLTDHVRLQSALREQPIASVVNDA